MCSTPHCLSRIAQRTLYGCGPQCPFPSFTLPQGNVDPAILFASKDAISGAVKEVLRKAGSKGHILNLGHGVLVGTPEDAVAHMFDLSKQMTHELAAR